jgi:hypothetical protein
MLAKLYIEGPSVWKTKEKRVMTIRIEVQPTLDKRGYCTFNARAYYMRA